MKAVNPERTPEAMLADMGLHARSSVVHVEPTTVAEWRECIGHVLCAAAFESGMLQVEATRRVDFAVARADAAEATVEHLTHALQDAQQGCHCDGSKAKAVDAAFEVCARIADDFDERLAVGAGAAIRLARGAK